MRSIFYRLCLSALCLGSVVACSQPTTSETSTSSESSETAQTTETATPATSSAGQPLGELWSQPQAKADEVLGEPTGYSKIDESLSTATYSGDSLDSRFPEDKVEALILTFFDQKLTAMNVNLNYDQSTGSIDTTPFTPEQESAALEKSSQLLQAFSKTPTIEPKLVRESEFIDNFGTSKTYCLSKEASTDIGPGHKNAINLVLNPECKSL